MVTIHVNKFSFQCSQHYLYRSVALLIVYPLVSICLTGDETRMNSAYLRINCACFEGKIKRLDQATDDDLPISIIDTYG